MQININNSANSVVVELSGMLNTETAPEFTNRMNDVDVENNNLIIDFKDTTYITSAGLRSLLILAKRAKPDLFKIINVNESVDEVFKMTGFDKMLSYSLIDETNKINNFVSLLNERLEKNKDDVICTYKEKEYTWEQIDYFSHIIANDLNKKGIKKGSHVGLCAPNSFNWFITFLAIQKLGGIAVLINDALKPAEIKSICEIGGTNFLCYGSSYNYLDNVNEINTISNNSIEIYNISDDIDFSLRKDEYSNISTLFREVFNYDDPSIIIFTSGSSGLPKAVLASAYNVIEPVNYVYKKYNCSNSDKSCAFLPFFHVFGLCSQISFAFLRNIPLFIPENKKPETIINTIDKYKCTMFNTVPTMMLAIVTNKEFAPERLASLRVSLLGGSITTEEQMILLKKMIPNNHFANIYGMSENAIISITKYEDSLDHVTKTVGLPPDYLDIEIREIGSNKVLNKNETGEICIRSKTMIVCYYNLDIDNQPIGTDGFLRTGDLGFIDEEGYITLNGRVKELIIRGGENISPSEVCNSITKLDEIADAKVLGVPDKIYGEEVAAAIVLKEGMSLRSDIKEELAKTTAKFKIPHYFIILDKLPLLGSGKVDNIKLKEIVINKINEKEYI